MIVLKAPYPNFVSKIILPNPKLGDGETVVRNVSIKRAMDNTVYSYVKTTSNVRLTYQIEMTRMKSLELENFISVYGGVHWYLSDHNGVEYDVVLMNEGLLKQNFKRALYGPTFDYGSEEAVTIDLEFEGENINS